MLIRFNRFSWSLVCVAASLNICTICAPFRYFFVVVVFLLSLKLFLVHLNTNIVHFVLVYTNQNKLKANSHQKLYSFDKIVFRLKLFLLLFCCCDVRVCVFFLVSYQKPIDWFSLESGRQHSVGALHFMAARRSQFNFLFFHR